MHSQRLAIIISAIIGIVAVFLPFAASWFNSVTLFETKDYSGYIVIALFVVSLIISVSGNNKEKMNSGQLTGSIITGIIPGLFMVVYAISLSNNDLTNLFTRVKIGFYLIILSSAAITILGLLLKDTEGTNEGTLQNKPKYCSNCGKQYSNRLSGEFCDECGNKL
jgi:hypothetical protein